MREIKVSDFSNMPWLSVINTLKSGKIFCIFLYEISKSINASGSFSGIHSTPRSILKGMSGRRYGEIYILFCGLGDGGKNSLVSWVNDVKGLVVDTIDKFSVDEKLLHHPDF